MRRLFIVILFIQAIFLNIVSFIVVPLAYSNVKSFLKEDFYSTNRIKYSIKTEDYTFVYTKSGESMFLKITDVMGQTLNLNISNVDESTIKNALFFDWTLVTEENGESTYIPSKNYCNYLEFNINVIPGMKTINDNYLKDDGIVYVLEPLRCMAKLHNDSIIDINSHFIPE